MAAVRFTRRAFLTASAAKPRVLALSCERLYIRYLAARDTNRVQEFLASLAIELETADHVHLRDPEWLDRDDFRAAVYEILHRRPITGP